MPCAVLEIRVFDMTAEVRFERENLILNQVRRFLMGLRAGGINSPTISG